MNDDVGLAQVRSSPDETGALIVRLDGEIDVSNVEEVTDALLEATETRRARCILDLSQTRYLDSSAIRMLFTVAARLRVRRVELFLLVPVEGVVRRLLEIMEIGSAIPMLGSIAEAPPLQASHRPSPDVPTDR